MRRIKGLGELRSLAGQRIGESDWIAVDQATVDTFADLTHDHNWIHVDPERARDSPFGSTIAHGMYSLALIGGLMQKVFAVDDIGMVLAYGLERVRFPQAVPMGSRIRVAVDLKEVRESADGAALDAVWRCVVEGEGFTKPACVADMLIRYFRAQGQDEDEKAPKPRIS